MRYLLLLLILPLLAACNLSSAPSNAATPVPPDSLQTCDEIVAEALNNVGPSCDATGRNQACYGYRLVDSQFRQGVTETFEKAGIWRISPECGCSAPRR